MVKPLGIQKIGVLGQGDSKVQPHVLGLGMSPTNGLYPLYNKSGTLI
jgi:hypothetical protein